jgi:hypothetical protein
MSDPTNHPDAMRPDRLGLTLRPQFPTAILEVSDKLFFLRVDGDHGLPSSLKHLHLGVDVFGLSVAVGMAGAFTRLAARLQTEVGRRQVTKIAGFDRCVFCQLPILLFRFGCSGSGPWLPVQDSGTTSAVDMIRPKRKPNRERPTRKDVIRNQVSNENSGILPNNNGRKCHSQT